MAAFIVGTVGYGAALFHLLIAGALIAAAPKIVEESVVVRQRAKRALFRHMLYAVVMAIVTAWFIEVVLP